MTSARTGRGFTLVEAAVVVAILGIIGTLAVPNLIDLVRGYRSREAARVVAFAFGGARGLSQKTNEAVRVRVFADRVEVSRPTYSSVVATIRYVNGWEELRSFPLGEAVITRVPTPTGNVGPGANAVFYLCPTGDAMFLTTSGTPLCPLGDMASNGGAIRFRVYDQPYSIEINAALAHLKLVTG